MWTWFWFMISTLWLLFFSYMLALWKPLVKATGSLRLGWFVLCIVGRVVRTKDDRALGSAFGTGILRTRTALNRLVSVAASFRPGT